MDGDTYDHSLQLHYRQYLVGLLFADLPSLSPFISLNDFYTCVYIGMAMVYQSYFRGCRILEMAVRINFRGSKFRGNF